jgi:TolB protein
MKMTCTANWMVLLIFTAAFMFAGCGGGEVAPGDVSPEAYESPSMKEPVMHDPLPGEKHLKNIRQITFGGENAEAYWSADGSQLIFQAKTEGMECDQIYSMDADGGNVQRISNGEGACTCSYFFPDGKRVLYSSTHLADPGCPAPADFSQGYVWKLHEGFDIFTADPDGGNAVQLTASPDYDAEATISVDGSKIIFTSMRDGDLDLYTMNADGSNVTQITHELGYDGGAFFSRDGKRIVWRTSRPKTDEEIADYNALLAKHEIRPMVLEVWVANADGSDARQVTNEGAASFGPYFFPDDKRILFCSNLADEGKRNFDLHMINDDGTGLEQVTFNETFDGFPMFSPDGKYLVFASNRNNAKDGETNVFIAEWVD